MELGMRSEKLKSFTALQSHFTKQLVSRFDYYYYFGTRYFYFTLTSTLPRQVGRGVDQREAREQAGDSMMCLVVADFNDASLRYMVDRWKKVILPEQSQLEVGLILASPTVTSLAQVSRARHEQTLYDQLVTRILKHQGEFPLSIIQEVGTIVVMI